MPLPLPLAGVRDQAVRFALERLAARFPIQAQDIDANAVGASEIGSLPAARVFNSAAISHTTSGTLQTLTFDSERFDTASLHSTVSNTSRLTAPVAGLYLITASILFASNATGFRQIALWINATTYIANHSHPAVNGAATAMSISTLYKLAANDYVEVQANQTSGGALNISASGNQSPEFSMTYLHDG